MSHRVDVERNRTNETRKKPHSPLIKNTPQMNYVRALQETSVLVLARSSFLRVIQHQHITFQEPQMIQIVLEMPVQLCLLAVLEVVEAAIQMFEHEPRRVTPLFVPAVQEKFDHALRHFVTLEIVLDIWGRSSTTT